jgi:hypothetical protein
MRAYFLCALLYLFILNAKGQSIFSFRIPKKSVYKEVNAEEMIRRYIAKTYQEGSIEGIYAVSCIITKRGKPLLSSQERERTVLRKENYARVAILKDWPGSSAEYVEVAVNDNHSPAYPIVAELTSLAGGGGFIYKHIEPKGETMTFTFLFDAANPEILEGVFSEQKGKNLITYRLTYIKTYPKNNNFSTTDR